MAQVFEPLFGLVEGKSPVCIDNNFFKLHYKVTFTLLTALSLLVTYTQYFGKPIDCIPSGNVPSTVMNAYCWIHPTFTIPKRVHGIPGKNFVQPGVAGHIAGEDEIIYHTYYQWVPIVLFFQAKLFFIPHFLWRTWENEKMKNLVLKENYFITHFERKHKSHTNYAYRFIFCEVLNFVNVTVQMYFLNFFLGGEFLTYGLEVIKFTQMDPETRVDPMSRMFPKVSKCTFYKYGPSGSIMNFDGLCILSLNTLNEKIYVFIWFWFIFLFITSLLSLIFNIFTYFSSMFRFYILRIRARGVEFKTLKYVMENSRFGDWFILYQMSKNVQHTKFKILIETLGNQK